MHNFKAITVGEIGCGPSLARNDVAVQLDSNAISFHPELFDEGGQGKPLGGKVALFAIDLQTHE